MCCVQQAESPPTLALLVDDAASYVACMAARRHGAGVPGEQTAPAEHSRAAPQGAVATAPEPALVCGAASPQAAGQPGVARAAGAASMAPDAAAAQSAALAHPAAHGGQANGDVGRCACAALRGGPAARTACPPALLPGGGLGGPSEGPATGLAALFLDCFDGCGEVPAQLLQQRFLADCAAALAPGVRARPSPTKPFGTPRALQEHALALTAILRPL